MFRRSILFAAALLVAGPGFAQPPASPQIQQTVVLSSFDAGTDTYSGFVNVNAAPCPGTTFSLNVGFSGARNADAARDQVKAKVAKIIEDIRQEAMHCTSR
jgi:hypothetical protein